MKILYYVLIFFVLSNFSSAIEPVAKWTFTNSTNPEKADIGQDLILVGSRTVSYSEELSKQYVTIPVGSYYKCLHNLLPSEGEKVNEYSMLFDFRISTNGKWYTFYQTDLTNSNDAELFINPSMAIGLSSTGYTSSIRTNEWYRLVIRVRNSEMFDFYIDSDLSFIGNAQEIDGRYAFEKDTVILFGDDNAEDYDIDISQVQIFDRPLTKNEIEELGGFSHNYLKKIYPYLQTPTDSTLIVSWCYPRNDSSKIVYYEDGSTSKTTIKATVTQISENEYLYSCQFSNLKPETEYHYKCYADKDSTDEFSFFSFPKITKKHGHFRMILIGDSENNPIMTEQTTSAIKSKLKELYGDEYYKDVNLIFHLGDVQGGGSLESYYFEFFEPFAKLSCNIPIMICTGNHEYNSGLFANLTRYKLFAEHHNESYYKFNYGPVSIFSLNSNMRDLNQLNWFKEQALKEQANDSTLFMFTFTHHPGHSEIWPDGNTYWVSGYVNWLLGTLSKSVLTANGHSHCYERGALEAGNTYTVISGGGGSGLDRWRAYPNQTDNGIIQKSLDIYNWVLIDVDLQDSSFIATAYSLGNLDKTADNVIVDTFSYKVNHNKHPQANCISPIEYSSNPIIVKTQFPINYDSIYCVNVQVSQFENFNKLLIDTIICKDNYYDDTNTPEFQPINLSENLKLDNINIADSLMPNVNFYYKLRYRDFYLNWSEYSPVNSFLIEILSIKDNNDTFLLKNGISSTCSLEINTNDYGNIEINIFDALGRNYFSQSTKVIPGTNIIPINTNINGMLFLKVSGDINISSSIIRE